MKIVELKTNMEGQFAKLDSRIGEFRTDMEGRFANVDSRFDELETRVEQKIAAEHETTRRHMEMLFEQSRAEYRRGLDRLMATDQQVSISTASNAREHTAIFAVLDDHEVRVKPLETPNEPRKTPRSST